MYRLLLKIFCWCCCRYFRIDVFFHVHSLDINPRTGTLIVARL